MRAVLSPSVSLEVVGAGEAHAALGTHVRSLPGVGHHVQGQVTLSAKGRLTLRARVGSEFRVHHTVLFHGGGGHEPGPAVGTGHRQVSAGPVLPQRVQFELVRLVEPNPTLRACVQLDPGVYAHVSAVGVGEAELAATLGAGEGLGVCVGLHVHLQVARGGQPGPTHLTWVRLLSCVTDLVQLEAVGDSEGSPTLRAHVRFLTCVHAHVSSQVAGIDEGSITLVTGVRFST